MSQFRVGPTCFPEKHVDRRRVEAGGYFGHGGNCVDRTHPFARADGAFRCALQTQIYPKTMT